MNRKKRASEKEEANREKKSCKPANIKRGWRSEWPIK
jgi:hypothetical protein